MGAPETFDPLADLRAAGLSVTLEAGKLIVRPASALTDDLRRIIRDQRTIILAALNAEAARERAQATEHAAQHRALVAELTPLVRACGEHYDFTEAEHADALRAALADPVPALECFRRMAGDLPRPARTAPARTATEQPAPRPACVRCRHRKTKFNPAGYCGQRQDLPPVYGDNHPLRHLPDDGGDGCVKFTPIY